MADNSNSLSQKLKAMGVRVGARDLPRSEKKLGFTIDRVVPGRTLVTSYGDTFLVDSLYPGDYHHGSIPLAPTLPLRMIHEWSHTRELVDADLRRFIFLDTETTGLAGGTGTYAFLVGIGRFVEGGFQLLQFFMRDPTEEPALLAALEESLSPCQALVTFNGKSFDAPLLTARYTLQGFTSPLSRLAHLDLLPLARRLWRDRLPSRALGSLEVSILGAARSQEEVPGWLIPQLYFDYLRSGDARPLAGVFYHNAQDILALAALFSHTAGMLDHPLDHGIKEGSDLVAIARLFDELGFSDEAALVYQKGLEHGMPEDLFWETIERLALLHRRRHEWGAAIHLWNKAAEAGRLFAFIELAKYYEHEARDHPQALQWTRSALELVNSPRFPPYRRHEALPELNHRLARLKRKCGGRNAE